MRVLLFALAALCVTVARAQDDEPPRPKLDLPDGLQALKHPSVQVRINAAVVLTKLGPTAKFAAPALREALKDAHPAMRVQAAQALWRVAPPPASMLVPVLVAEVREPKSPARLGALMVLGEMGPAARAALPAVRACLKDDELKVQLEAVLTLGQLGAAAQASVPDLLELAGRDKEGFLSASISRSLGQMGAGVVVPLAEGLRSGNVAVRRCAAQALSYHAERAPQVLAALQAGLHDDDEQVRLALLETLAKIGPTASAAAARVAELRGKPPTPQSVQAAYTLVRITGKADQTSLELLRAALGRAEEVGLQAKAARLLGEIGPDAQPAAGALVAQLRAKDLDVSGACVAALGKLGKGALPHLKEVRALLAAEHDPLLRVHAALASWRLQPRFDDAVAAALKAGLADELSSVRVLALQALRAIGREAQPLLPEVLPLLRDDDEAVRTAAADALRVLDPELAKQRGLR